jgi:hypothetical protein
VKDAVCVRRRARSRYRSPSQAPGCFNSSRATPKVDDQPAGVHQEQGQPGARGEEAGEALGPALLGGDELAKPLMISVESAPVISCAGLQLAGQHAGRQHGQRRALPGERGHAERGVAHQRHPAMGPAGHPDLADPVEVEVLAVLHRLENRVALPGPVMISSLSERQRR